jgi:hypothetical protein
LQEKLVTVGSTELPLIWKEKTTPAGRSIFRLAPSMRRTSVNASTGVPWSTPLANQKARSEAFRQGRNPNLQEEVVAIWSTPRASDGEKGGPNMSFGAGGQPLPAQAAHTWPTPRVGNNGGYGNPDRGADGANCRIEDTAAMLHLVAPWSTPTVQDAENCAGPSQFQRNSQALNGQAVTHSAWPTPAVADVEGGRKSRSGARSGELLLNGLAATWPTPQAGTPAQNGYNEAGSTDFSRRVDTIVGARAAPNAPRFGPTTNGEPAQTEKRGALNPEFVFWLMGMPTAWQHSVSQAMQSLPRSPRKSSKR